MHPTPGDGHQSVAIVTRSKIELNLCQLEASNRAGIICGMPKSEFQRTPLIVLRPAMVSLSDEISCFFFL